MVSAKWRPFCLGLNELIWSYVALLVPNEFMMTHGHINSQTKSDQNQIHIIEILKKKYKHIRESHMTLIVPNLKALTWKMTSTMTEM